MRSFILFFLLLSNTLFAQTALTFDKSFIECEDRWVAFPAKDSGYTYGFVYIDAEAGPTMQYGGQFMIAPEGKYVRYGESVNESIKIRLQPGGKKVTPIPEQKLADLQLPFRPEWLIHYKSDTTSVKHLYQWGYIYNEWGKPELAVFFLEDALRLDPKAHTLISELAYTYNAIKEYDRALKVLSGMNKKTCYDYKELTYALVKLLRLVEADVMCKEAMSACDDMKMKAEIAYNLAVTYYEQKDIDNYKVWAKETQKWAQPDDMFSQAIKRINKKI